MISSRTVRQVSQKYLVDVVIYGVPGICETYSDDLTSALVRVGERVPTIKGHTPTVRNSRAGS